MLPQPLLEALEGRTLLSTLVPVADHRDLIYDPTRNYLYITTASGRVQRYDVAAGTLLSPIDTGTSLMGGDITSDGQLLYVADGGAPQLRKVNLVTGAVASIPYAPAFGEANGFDVAVLNNGKALFTTQYSGSGWVPLRQLDLALDTFSTRPEYPGGIEQNTTLDRSADRSTVFLQGSNISSGPITLYDATSDTFRLEREADAFVGYGGAVNRDGTLIAMALESVNPEVLGSPPPAVRGVSVMDRAFGLVRNFPQLTGGMGFDPLRDVLYAVDAASDEIVALNTVTWQEQYRLPIGENVTHAARFDDGMIEVSADGSKLFLATPLGVRIFDVPQPTGIASRAVISGFPRFIKSGVNGTFTLTITDPAGRPVTNFTGTVRFSSDDPGATLPPDYTFTPADAGSHTFTAALKALGERSITASVVGAPAVAAAPARAEVHGSTVAELIPVLDHPATSFDRPRREGMVFDPVRKVLYISSPEAGVIERFDTVTQTLLSPIRVTGAPAGIDITPDGSALYVANAARGAVQGVIQKVDLATGAVTHLPFDLRGGEGGVNSMVVAPNGRAFFTTWYEGSGPTPIRQVATTNNAITVRTDVGEPAKPAAVRGQDRSRIYFRQLNVSPNTAFTYVPATDSFSPGGSTAAFLRHQAAVSRDGSLFATESEFSGVDVYDAAFNLVRSLPHAAGGLAFDPVRDLLYAANDDTGRIVIYDTTNWQVAGELPMGPFWGSEKSFLSTDEAGEFLFLATIGGVRVYSIGTRPHANSGGPYAVLEGRTVNLDGSGFVLGGGQIVKVEWDLNYDGLTFDADVNSGTATFSAAGIDGPTTRQAALRVTDSAGNTSVVGTQLFILNALPTFNITAGQAVFPGQTYSVNLAATDPGGADTVTSWHINWGDSSDPDGDGQVGQVVTGNPANVTHTYTRVGNFPIAMTATDEDGTHNGPIRVVSVIAPPSLSAAGAMTVGGSGGADVISLRINGQFLVASVQLAGMAAPLDTGLPLSNIRSINISAGGGNDTVTIHPGVAAIGGQIDLGNGDDQAVLHPGGLSATALDVLGQSGNDTVTLLPGVSNNTFFDGGNETDRLIFPGSPGNDVFTATPGTGAQTPYTFLSGGGASASYFRVERGMIEAGAGADLLTVTTPVGPLTSVITDTTVTGIFSTFEHVGLEAVSLDAGDGNDTINVNITDTGPAVSVKGGAGDDHVNLNSTGTSSKFSYDPVSGSDGVNISSGSHAIFTPLSAVAATAVDLVVNGAQVVFAVDQRLDAVSLITGKVTLAVGNKGLFATSLNMGPAATLDLSDGVLAVQPGASTAETLRTYLRSAYNNGRWDGPGITSVFAADLHAQGLPLLGLSLLPNDNGAGQPRLSAVAGRPLDAATLLIRAALYGDFNSDHKVNISDFFTADTGRAMDRIGYAHGDVDHSGGGADADDYMLIDRTFLKQSQLPPGAPASPAPPAPLPPSTDLWPADDDEPVNDLLS